MKGFAVLDLETTGFSGDKDRIVEIGIALFDSAGTLEETFSTLLNPQRDMPQAASRVNGITTAMLRGQRPFGAVANQIAGFLEDRVLVGHNIASFDRRFLVAEFKRAGVSWTCGPLIDTLKVAKLVHPSRGSYKLTDLCRQAGIQNQQAHRALGDVIATWQLLCALAKADTHDAAGLQQYGVAGFPNLTAVPAPPQSPSARITRTHLDTAALTPQPLPAPTPAEDLYPPHHVETGWDLVSGQSTTPNLGTLEVRGPRVVQPEGTSVARGAVRAYTWQGPNWQIELDADGYHVTRRHVTTLVTLEEAELLWIRRRWFRWMLYAGNTRLVWLRGLPKHEAAILPLVSRLDAVVRWSTWYRELRQRALDEGRWLPYETTAQIKAVRPDASILSAIRDSLIDPELSMEVIEALQALVADVDRQVAQTNEQILANEQLRMREFFGLLEARPLSGEQQQAVIAFDNRVRLVAAAGSGKTSVLVARAAYAVKRGFVPPARILMLAFNRNAAEELRTRTDAAFRSVGLDATDVQISTFHAFGLEVVGAATGEKPRPAPWLDTGQDLEKLRDIVASLRRESPVFDYEWTMFRLLFSDTPDTPDGGQPDHYDRATKAKSFRTLDGHLVKSHGERMIADWLYLHGVHYEYERPYPHKTADRAHSQYHPDFYYPDLDLWHEHWALDRKGRPPTGWTDYSAGIAWKRATHQKHGTQLLETSFGDVVFGDGLKTLEKALRARGAQLDWDPSRALAEHSTMSEGDLLKLIRTFMIHDKGGAVGPHEINRKLATTHTQLASVRTVRFLRIYTQVRAEWDRQLREGGYVDFEEMLTHAAALAASGAYDSPYRLVLVDEFQDMSSARLRILQGVTKKPDTFLLAVGDDWQSINRFAGADVGIMGRFEKYLGTGPTLALTTTFRCPQRICDVSSAFVQKNQTQLRKKVNSVHGPHSGRPLEIVSTTDMRAALHDTLARLGATIGGPASTRSVRPRVLVLGRYRSDADYMPTNLPTNLDVEYSTVHSAKGSEADYVVVVNVTSGTRGFPSSVTDDPVLDLVLVAPEALPHAEERRLLYVALTRARETVVVLTQTGRESIFLPELGDPPLVQWSGEDGKAATPPQICPTCGEGILRERTGPYGVFLGCSRFPACTGKATRRR